MHNVGTPKAIAIVKGKRWKKKKNTAKETCEERKYFWPMTEGVRGGQKKIKDNSRG